MKEVKKVIPSKELYLKSVEGEIIKRFDEYQKDVSTQNVFTPAKLVHDMLKTIGCLEGKDVLIVANYDIAFRVALLKAVNNAPAYAKNSTNEYNYRSLTFLTDVVELNPKDETKFEVVLANLNEPAKIDMMGKKFDVVIGNPPYQDTTGAARSKAIWPEFVKLGFDVLVEGGTLSLIHPNGWRIPSGKFSKVRELLLSNNMKYLYTADFNEGQKVFKAGTSFDWYVVTKEEYKGQTVLNNVKGEVSDHNITELDVIGNHSQDLLNSITTANEEDRIDYIYHTKYHTQRDYISKEKTDTHKYPVVYTITTRDSAKLTYSSRNDLGHFGETKLIWSNGMGTNLIIDEDGEYGLNEFAFAIGGDVEYLKQVKVAMESEKFLELMSAIRFNNNKYFSKVIETFKKDFWKQFVD